MKIVVAVDSFKGSLTSTEVADAVVAGIRNADTNIEIVAIAGADGGEGTSAIITNQLKGKWIECEATGATGQPIKAHYGIVVRDGISTAVIDVASTCALTLVNPTSPGIMHRSTRGVGELILDACQRGCRHIIVGLGGSSTCDAGMGMLSALGVKFIDSDGNELDCIAQSMTRVASIDISQIHEAVNGCEFTVMCDVSNPLYGEEGAAIVFAPQKGAGYSDVINLERGLRNMAVTARRATDKNLSAIKGAGAAGGLGWAFATFLNGKICSGADAILDLMGFDDAVVDADLVITGEGMIDEQTIGGKFPMVVCDRANRHIVPTVAIAGRVKDRELLIEAGFADAIIIHQQYMSLSKAMRPDITTAAIKKTVKKLLEPVG